MKTEKTAQELELEQMDKDEKLVEALEGQRNLPEGSWQFWGDCLVLLPNICRCSSCQ